MTVWKNLPDQTTPISAEALNYEFSLKLDTTTAASTYSPMVSVLKFGAVGDGVTDCTAAFNAAIAYGNALLGNDREGVKGVTFIIPDGRYVLPTALNPITVSGVSFAGESRDGAVLLLSSATTTFTWGDSTLTRLPLGGGLRRMKLEYSADTAGSVVTLDYAFDTEFSDLQLVRIPTLLRLGVSATRIAGGTTVRNVHGSVANIGVPLFDVRFGAGLMVSDSSAFVRGVLPPTHPAAMTTVVGTYVFSCMAGGWDTIQVSNCIFERFDFGFIVIPGAGKIYQNFMLSNVIFDYCKRQGIYLDSTNGIVSGFRTRNCWAMSWEESSIQILGGSMNDFHDIEMIVPISGKGALHYAATTAKSNHFKLSVGANSRAAALAGAVHFASGAKGFYLHDSDGNDDLTAAGTPWRNDWGVYVGADCNDYIISGCRFTGALGGGYNLAANSAGSLNRRVAGNVGTGYAGTAPITMAASNALWVNTAATVCEVFVYGGSVTAIYKNTVAIAGMTSGHVTLNPGESVAATYTTVPSVTQFVMA